MAARPACSSCPPPTRSSAPRSCRCSTAPRPTVSGAAEAQSLAGALPELPETEARRRWRAVSEALHALVRIDYYPGAAAEQAQAELDALREALDARFSRGEPVAQAPHGIPRLDPRKFQGKRWATRARPWVDRLACAWLIRRFIDMEARFVWLADPGWVHARTPRRTGLRLRRRALHARRRTRHLRGAGRQFWPGRGPATASALRARCTSWTSAASRCPRRPGLRRCSPVCARFMPMTIELTLAAAAVFDALHAAPGAPA